MLIKPYEEAKMTLGLRALARRLTSKHPLYEQMARELLQAEAGEHGEKYIMKQLEKLSFVRGFHVLHNISLQRPFPMQLDIVVITQYEVIIIESKNIKGEVELKNRPRQLIRTLETGERRVFHHPEVQLEEYVYNLKEFFNQNQIEVPVHGIIVFPFNNARIDYEDGLFSVLMAREVTGYLQQRSLKTKPIDSQSISALLVQHHKPYELFPLCRYYGIEVEAIQTGVICPECQIGQMQWLKMKWICSSCLYSNKKAHKCALQDYGMLINKSITNSQAQHFLQLNNRHTVKRMLMTSCYRKEGVSKRREYQIHL